jgi:hypothetical protein
VKLSSITFLIESMEKITTVQELRSAIHQLESKQAGDWAALKKECVSVAETLKPGNIIKTTFTGLLSEPYLRTTVINAVLGLTTGFVANTMFPRQVPGALAKFVAGTIVGSTTARNLVKYAVGIRSLWSKFS